MNTAGSVDGNPENSRLSGDFLVFSSSKFFTGLGSGLFTILLPWMVLSLTGSPLITGLADGLVSIPLMFSFVMGTVVDRQRRKKLLYVLATLGIAFSFIVLGESIDTHLLVEKVAFIFTATLLFGFFDDIQDSVSSFFDKVMLTETQIKKGMSLRRAVLSSSILTGYAASAFFITSGFYFTLISLVLIFLLAAAIILPVRYAAAHNPKKEEFLSSLGSGIREFIGNPFLKELFLMASVVNFFWGMLTIGFTVFVERYMEMPVYYYSAIMVSMEVGVLAGTVVSGRLRVLGGKFLILSTFLWGFIFFGVYYSASMKSYLPVVALILGAGFISGIVNVFISGAIVKSTPEDMMARISGSLKTLFDGFTFLSGAVAGIILTYVSVPVIFSLLAVSMIITGSVALLRFENVKRAEL